MKGIIKDKKLHFIEYTQAELNAVRSLLIWTDEDDVTLLFNDTAEPHGIPFTFWGLCNIIKKRLYPFKLTVENEPEVKYQKIEVANDILDNVTLYNFQVAAIKKALLVKNGVLDIPTGGGKTEVMLGILKVGINKIFDKALVIVPSVYLAEQFCERAIKRGFDKSEIGAIHGNKKDYDKNITVGVVNSIHQGIQKDIKEIKDLVANSNMLMYDECHHLKGYTYLNIAQTSNAEYILGVSGSPFHDDNFLENSGDALVQGITGGVIYKLSQKYLRDLGLIATPCVNFVKITGRMFKYPGWNNVYKRHVITHKKRNKYIIDYANKFSCMDCPVLILIQRKDHAINLLKELPYNDTICIFGGEAVQKDELGLINHFNLDYDVFIQNFNKGFYKIIIATQIFDEGVDIPSIGAVIMAGAGRCFVEGTKISLLNGKEEAIETLVGKNFWLYGCDQDGTTISGKGTAFQTGYTNVLTEIELDNGCKERCTPDHLWMLRDGSYKEAQYLQPDDSLMPLYREIDENGYEQYKDNKDGEFHKTHSLVAYDHVSGIAECWKRIKENNQIDRHLVVHHIDFNKRNNDPPNLQWQGENEHWRYHSSLGGNPIAAKKLSERLKKNWTNLKYRKRMTQISKNVMLKLNKDPEFKEKAKQGLYKKWKDLEYRERMATQRKELNNIMWLDENFREKHKKAVSESSKRNWTNLKYRNMMLSVLKEKIWDNLEHWKMIGKLAKERWKNPEYKAHMSPIMSKNAKKQWTNPKFKSLMSKVMTDVNEKLWHSPEYERFRTQISETARKTFIQLNKDPNQKIKQKLGKFKKILEIIDTEEINQENYEKARATFSFPGAYPNWGTYSRFESKINHKVVSVKQIVLEEPVPIYDIETKNKLDTCNFALSSGIFVHNSKIKFLQRLGRGLRRKVDQPNRVYILDFKDHSHVFLFAQYKKRLEMYKELEIEVYDDDVKFFNLVKNHYGNGI